MELAAAFKPNTANPNESLWEEVPCTICGSRESRVKYAGTTDEDTEKLITSYCASGNFVSKETLVECAGCQLIYTSPRLRQDLILKGYSDTEDPTYVSQAKGRLLSFRQCLKALNPFLPKTNTERNVLDVGAAAGFFLKVAKDAGWTPYGIEPSRFLSSYGNQHFEANIVQGTIESTPKQWQGKMDLVTLWDVLEHTLDPKDVLTRCRTLLKDEGLLVINYPNIGNWMARLAGKSWWFILSVHLYYFTPKTIERLLRETGFECVNQAPHFQWLEFGYLLYRLEAYLPKLARFFGSAAKRLGIDKTLVPYFAAQTRVIARKASC